MDEDQYRSTYNSVNPNRCVFEKSINNRRCNCDLKHRFLIATREGVACRSEKTLSHCTNLLDKMRDNARFALKVIMVDGPMPHNKELKVQAGGMIGLQKLMYANDDNLPDKAPDTVENIHQVIDATLLQYGSLDNIPYNLIVQDIAACQVRPKRRSKK
ncbi:MAG: hypothetical protein DSZ29_04110 [Aquificaceae bacterium]|nr:MAG: hypothetical protein DSZ29_04110 [Aquificaceae bacterium]